MARRPLAYALTRAAFRDGVALVSTVVRFVAVDPAVCRLVGHHWHVWVTDHADLVCDRCGRTERAR